MAADQDADPEQGERRYSEHDSSPRPGVGDAIEADVADRHRQWTVVPRFSKKLMIAGAAPTMNAATAEMTVPRRPSAEW